MPQSFTKHTYYKVYTGSAWEIISFKTDAADVGVNSTRKFLTNSVTVNGKTFTLGSNTSESASVVIYAGDIKMSSASNADSIADKIGEMAATIETLQTQDPDLTAIAALTGTGLLKRTGDNTWALDTNTYLKTGDISSWAKASSKPTYTASEVGAVPTTRTVNGEALSGNITLYGSDIKLDRTGSNPDLGNYNSKTITDAINDILNIANGRVKAFATTLYDGDSIVFGIAQGNASDNVSSLTNTTTATVVSNTDSIEIPSGYTYLYLVDASGMALGEIPSIKLSDLKVGDVLYITDTNVPDFWFDGYSFQKLETTKVDISNYVTQSYLSSTLALYSLKSATVSNVTYDTASHIISKNINGTSQDVVDLDSFAKIANGVITIGSNTITPLTSHQAMKYRPISVAGTEKLSNSASTALNFLNTGNVQFTYDGGLKASVDLSSYMQNNRITIAGTAPDSPKTNDIWFDTSA